MTTIYLPVPITSAEQAEALPVTTRARIGSNVIVKGLDGQWWWPGLEHLVTPQSEAAVGWTALVPIEAEEETRLHESPLTVQIEPTNEAARAAVIPMVTMTTKQTRYVTPWEEAS